MNKRSGCLLAVGLALIGGVCFAALALALGWADRWAASFHQRGVTRSLAGWEKEYGRVQSWQEARRAADMLEYVQRYYVPGGGYQGDAATEERLEAQRARTVEAIAAGLREFTGRDFGTDAEGWQRWLKDAEPGRQVEK